MSTEKTQDQALRDAFCKLHDELHEAECCAEQNVRLSVLPIYEAYRRASLVDAGDALRLTFLELQNRIGYALTWPG